MVKILAALLILDSSGASPGATKKVSALIGRATCSGASHSQCCQMEYRKFLEIWGQNFSRNEKKSGDSHFYYGILPVVF